MVMSNDNITNPCGRRQNKTSPKNTLLSMSVNDMVEYLRSKGIKTPSRKREDLCALILAMVANSKIVAEKEDKTSTNTKKIRTKTKILIPPTVIESENKKQYKKNTKPLKPSLDFMPRVIYSKTTVNKKSHIKDIKKTPQKSVYPIRIKQPHLKYNNNSCYVDSTLLALFHGNNQWIKRNILKKSRDSFEKYHNKNDILIEHAKTIQQELIDIYNGNIQSCSNLRSLFERFDNEYSKYNRFERIEWRRTQQEPRDVFNMLMRIFPIPDSIVLTVNGNERRESFSSPYIPAFELHNKKVLALKDYFPEYQDATKIRYLSAPFICFNIERNFLDRKMNTKVLFPEKLNALQDPCCLQLQAVIIHNGNDVKHGHYTCLLRNNNAWYLYDDMSNELEFVCDHFHEIETWKKGYILKNATTLVYF